jgi:hypothetical protein
MTKDEELALLRGILERYPLALPAKPWRTTADQEAFIKALSPSELEIWEEAILELKEECLRRLRPGESGGKIRRNEDGVLEFGRWRH